MQDTNMLHLKEGDWKYSVIKILKIIILLYCSFIIKYYKDVQIQSKALFESISANVWAKPYFIIKKINLLGLFQSSDKKTAGCVSPIFDRE